MDLCLRMYNWMTRTIVAIGLVTLWRLRQLSDYFVNGATTEEVPTVQPPSEKWRTHGRPRRPLRSRRIIRSMSDVRNTSPYPTTSLTRRWSKPTLGSKYLSRHNLVTDSSDDSGRTRERKWANTALHGNIEDALVMGYVMSPDPMRYL